MLEIISNGSKWQGQPNDSIETLCEVLKKYTLDPMFEKYGNFVNYNPQWIKPESKEKYAGCVLFFGNFYGVSHVFNLITDEPELINTLETLINANKLTEDYQQAKEELQREEAEKEQRRNDFIKNASE